MASLCRFLFFFLLVKPLATLVLGLNVHRRELLPSSGPAVLVANHNSHLDTLVLLALFPYRTASRIRPIAACDYFLRNRTLAWFSLRVLRIIPLERASARTPDRPHRAAADMLRGVSQALHDGDIVLLYPEGTRGEPEHLGELRPGVTHLARMHPNIPIVPVFLHGTGKAMPRGDSVLVPFFCDIFVGQPLPWKGRRDLFMHTLNRRFHNLAAEGEFPQWA